MLKTVYPPKITFCRGIKTIVFVETKFETFLQSFSFIPYTASEEFTFFIFFHKFPLLVAMVTNQIKRLKKKDMFGSGPLKEHFCKRFVEISVTR